MRFGLFVASAFISSLVCCSANTITDPFAQSQANCNLSTSAPYSNCDVIGNEALYDIQAASVSITKTTTTVSIYTNSGAVKDNNGQLTLSSFSDSGVSLIPGDIFFYNPTSVYDPSDPNTTQYLQYGISLTNHGSFQAGDLYAIGGGISAETAQTALNSPNAYYRRDQTVLMTGSGSPASSGTISIANYGNGVTNAEFVITVTVPTTTGLLNLESNGQIGLVFSSADCGNDVIQGTVGVTQTPEPGPAVMMLSGVVLLIVGRAWRRRTA